jgi:hypothetical protein
MPGRIAERHAAEAEARHLDAGGSITNVFQAALLFPPRCFIARCAAANLSFFQMRDHPKDAHIRPIQHRGNIGHRRLTQPARLLAYK